VRISAATRRLVRERAGFACEYCSVTETDAGSELTIDHFQPRACGGTDDTENLLYCCHRCNEYKADYWQGRPDDIPLWNPRREQMDSHLLLLADGVLYPITPVGVFTLRRLRLNRPALVAFRLRRRSRTEDQRLLTQYRDLVTSLEHLQRQHAALLRDHADLLAEQRALLRLLLGQGE
jgi:hypothetical protein